VYNLIRLFAVYYHYQNKVRREVMNFGRFNQAFIGARRYSTMKFPLAGVRILDLSRIIAGPYCVS
jgi:hypothetical protein